MLLPHKDPEARKRYDAEWRARNRDRLRQVSREFRLRHQERSRAEAREYQRARYHAKTKHSEAYRAIAAAKSRAWYAANSQKAKEYSAFRRRNALIQRGQAPKWANWFFISEIYDLARRRTKLLGIPHEVDHIIPLRGKTVCGLHVETNLRVVPKVVNRAKASHFIA